MVQQPYREVLLDPRPGPAASSANDAAFALGEVLGIEVTLPALAARCTLGNIDPQHSGSDATCAAIEEAIDSPLPAAGSILATIRPDLDAFGAMAVLSLRHAGLPLVGDVRTRICAIGAADRFDHGPWRPQQLPAFVSLGGPPALSVLGAAVADHTLPVEHRVDIVRSWLVSGAVPDVSRFPLLNEVSEFRAALQRGEIVVHTHAAGVVAFVETRYFAALRYAYRYAPVVVARNPAFRFRGGEAHVKFTIAQWAPGHADLGAVARALDAIEQGWGGSPTIIGSPQGIGSVVDAAVVVRAVVNECSSQWRADPAITPNAGADQ